MIDAILLYLIIGSLVWIALDLRGHVAKGLNESAAYFGTPVSRGASIVATVATIVLWPLFVLAWLRQLRG